MKRLFVILLILCAWVTYPMLYAQIYTTSSLTYKTVHSGEALEMPTAYSFRSTSAFSIHKVSESVRESRTYSTAPMRMATGTITTVASQLQGGQLAEDNEVATPIRGRRNTMAPPTDTEELLPIGDGWDVAMLLAILCVLYGLYLRRNAKRQVVK